MISQKGAWVAWSLEASISQSWHDRAWLLSASGRTLLSIRHVIHCHRDPLLCEYLVSRGQNFEQEALNMGKYVSKLAMEANNGSEETVHVRKWS